MEIQKIKHVHTNQIDNLSRNRRNTLENTEALFNDFLCLKD